MTPELQSVYASMASSAVADATALEKRAQGLREDAAALLETAGQNETRAAMLRQAALRVGDLQ